MKLLNLVLLLELPVLKNRKVNSNLKSGNIKAIYFIFCLGIKEHYRNKNFKISLKPVIEYSLELPYGRQARIWVTTETACYRIMSVSANYISYWQPFYEMVCFAGHVVNILLNYQGAVQLVRLVGKISRLSKNNEEATYNLLKDHRKFIQDLLKDQNLSAKIRKEYNALQSNQPIWDLSWEEHSKSPEKKIVKPLINKKSDVLSFFRSRSDEKNVDSSTRTSAASFDDTSSLLSISEDESATYIEYPFESFEETNGKQQEELTVKNHLKSSVTSAQFLEWKLPESEFLKKESFYNCPLCKTTFKTDVKDCFSSFIVHLRAHRADCISETYDGSLVNDFESRFNDFKINLQNIIDGEISYSPIPLKFEKKINDFSASVAEKSFKKYSLIEFEENLNLLAGVGHNPITAHKFSQLVPSISSVASSKTPSPVPPTAVSATPVKKPRARKPKVVLPVTQTSAPLIAVTDNSSGPSSSSSSSYKESPLKPVAPTATTVTNLYNQPPSLPATKTQTQAHTIPIIFIKKLVTSPVNIQLPNIVVDQENTNTLPAAIPQIQSSPPRTQTITLTPQKQQNNIEPSSQSRSHALDQQVNVNSSNYSLSSAIKRPFSAIPVPIEKLGSESEYSTKSVVATVIKTPSPVSSSYSIESVTKSPDFLVSSAMKSGLDLEESMIINSKSTPSIHVCEENRLTPAVPSLPSQADSVNNERPDQSSYVNYLKESLAYWRHKAPSTNRTTPIDLEASSVKQTRNCWNCMNTLPDGNNGSIQNKYCLHCSAIIE